MKEEPGKPHAPVIQNRKARFQYEILDTVEAGVELLGSEVKSIRAGRATIGDSFARIQKGEVFLHNAHVAEWTFATVVAHEPLRVRRLLLHRGQILKLQQRVREKGCTLVPLRLFWKGPWAKIELALVRGKRQFDKRAAIAKADAVRAMRAAVARRVRGR